MRASRCLICASMDPTTMLVYTNRECGVKHGSRYEEIPVRRILPFSSSTFKQPKSGQIYSVNEGISDEFDPSIFLPISHLGKNRNLLREHWFRLLRISNRNLRKGGFTLYPCNGWNILQSKLRLFDEAKCFGIYRRNSPGSKMASRRKIFEILWYYLARIFNQTNSHFLFGSVTLSWRCPPNIILKTGIPKKNSRNQPLKKVISEVKCNLVSCGINI